MDSNKLLNRWTSSNRDVNSQLVVSENLLDSFFNTKVAAESMDEEACKILSAYVAFTRALYILHQQSHWEAQAYGDHLLFQRLYEDAQEISDDAAERAKGLCGDKVIFEGEEAIAKKFEPKIKTLSSLLESSLEIEKAFQVVNQNTYDALKAKDMITLGLDDLLMSQASQGEVHIYLLQQALKGLGEGSVEDHAKEILEKTEALTDILVVQAKKRKPEYKPKDIIEFIESSLKVRPYEEVIEYVHSLDQNMLDQVINTLMKTNPALLKRIFVSSITKKPEIEQPSTPIIEPATIEPATIEPIEANIAAIASFISEAGRKRKPEYKANDVIRYIESALRVRPAEEVFSYVRGLDGDLLDQVINVLMKTNPNLLKRIFVNSIPNKLEEVELESKEPPLGIDDVEKSLVVL
jgi:DNA-binding ferritin-like protein